MDDPFPFEKLPAELKIKIVRSLLPPMVIPEDLGHNLGIVVARERAATNDLILASKGIHTVLAAIRRLLAITSYSGLTFTFDPMVDTLLVRNMKLPKFVVGTTYEPLPIRKLMTTSRYPMLPTVIDRTCWMADLAHEWTWDLPGIDPAAPWKALPFDTSLPVLSTLPYVEEMVISVQNAPFAWHIEGFQQFGPPVLGNRSPNMNFWGLTRDYPFPWGANFFASLGVKADTGIEWKFPMGMNGHERDRISDPADLLFDLPGRYCKPMIGFLGYNKGNTSLGGKWAGFRYHVQTQKIEFRPLTWSEVEHYVNRMHTPPGVAQTLPENQHPQFVAKVWVIRGQAQPEPEKNWVKVKEWVEDDPDWVKQLETT